jgi:type I restriction enzyme S subunit
MSHGLSEDELPTGWVVAQLGELVEIRSTQVDPASTPKVSFNYVAMENVEKGTGSLINFSPMLGEKIGSSKNVFKAGDILYGKLRPYLRKTVVAPFDGVSVTDLVALRPRTGISSDFIKYFLLSPYHMEYISLLMAGIRMPRIRTEDLLKMPIPTPPASEQRRIVARLEELLGRVETCRKRLEQVPRLLKQFRQSVLATAFSGRLTGDWREENADALSADEILTNINNKRAKWLESEIKKNSSEAKRLKRTLDEHTFETPDDAEIPPSWSWSSLLNACWLVVDCHNKTAPYVKEGIPLIRTTNIKSGRLLLDETKYVTEVTYQYWSRRCPPAAGDILFTREAPMGESALIPQGVQLCMGQRMMLLRVFKDLLNPKYLSYALLDPLFLSRVDKNSVGSGVKHLRVGDVESLTIPIPPFREQLEIAGRVEALFKIADAVEDHYRKAQEQLDKLPQSILAKAFRGELVTQDPGDEPASVLLERIRTGKAETGKPEKKIKRPVAAKSKRAAGRSTLF